MPLEFNLISGAIQPFHIEAAQRRAFNHELRGWSRILVFLAAPYPAVREKAGEFSLVCAACRVAQLYAEDCSKCGIDPFIQIAIDENVLQKQAAAEPE